MQKIRTVELDGKVIKLQIVRPSVAIPVAGSTVHVPHDPSIFRQDSYCAGAY